MKLNLLKPLRKIFTILSGNNSEDKDLVTVVDKIANVLEENNVNIKNSLPEITENDEDKIIGIVNGKYEKIDQINFEPETIAPKQIVTISETVPKADIQLIQNLNISGISDISDATVIVNGRAFKYDNNYNIFYYDYLEKEIIYLIEEKRENDTFLGITFTAYDNTGGNGSNIISGDYTVEIVRPKNNNGGGGTLIVTFTATVVEGDPVFLSDKQFNEVASAINTGQNVVGLTKTGTSGGITLNLTDYNENGINFQSIMVNGDSLDVIFVNFFSNDEITVGQSSYPLTT